MGSSQNGYQQVNNFFDQADTFQRRPYGALHLYALPEYETGVFDAYAEIAPRLRHFTNLAIQPAEFLHVTLRRLEIYEGEEPDGWDTLISDLAQQIANADQFELQFNGPVLAPASVAAQATPNRKWHALQQSIADSFSRAGLAKLLTAAPSIPHYTLAYSRERAAKSPIENALRDSHFSSSILIKNICLVSVDQDRQTGIFSFRTLNKWSLK